MLESCPMISDARPKIEVHPSSSVEKRIRHAWFSMENPVLLSMQH